MSAIRFRKAKPADAAALGELHVASWRETYAGLVPGPLLDALSVKERSAMWSAILRDAAGPGDPCVFVAERDGAVIGFGSCGKQRDEALKHGGFDGEVGAIYVLGTHQGVGVGSSLMGLMARALLARRRTGAALWVLGENVIARTFYERLGGTVVANRVDEAAGATLAEVAYGWRDVSALIR